MPEKAHQISTSQIQLWGTSHPTQRLTLLTQSFLYKTTLGGGGQQDAQKVKKTLITWQILPWNTRNRKKGSMKTCPEVQLNLILYRDWGVTPPSEYVPIDSSQSINGGIHLGVHCLAHSMTPTLGVPLVKSPCRSPYASYISPSRKC